MGYAHIKKFHFNSQTFSGVTVFNTVKLCMCCVRELFKRCWEGYFENVIRYRLQVTILKM